MTNELKGTELENWYKNYRTKQKLAHKKYQLRRKLILLKAKKNNITISDQELSNVMNK